MARTDFKKEGPKGQKKEEIKYPCSPRSQKWIGNLLPVLESYNYNYSEIIQLVRNCDYNADKIQEEVERIMEMNIGHEQGEWEVVRPSRGGASSSHSGSREPKKGPKNQEQFKGKQRPERRRNVPVAAPQQPPQVQKPPKEEKEPTVVVPTPVQEISVEESVPRKSLFTSWASLLKSEEKVTVEEPKLVPEEPKVEAPVKKEPVKKSPVVKPAVVLPKEINFGSDASLMFGCLEEDNPWSKPSVWQDQVTHWQPNRVGHVKMNRNGRVQDPIPGENLSGGHWQGSYYERFNKQQLVYTYSEETDKQKSFQMPESSAQYPQKERDPVNGVYFNYPYANDRLQNPPGLVGYYTTPQPYYGFNGTNNANSTNNISSSMWQN
ncbi:conserved hypothetical protein [Theileria equi strain WA]|uniref:Uncharacterized protein n=1 Tax=Theileria equi strain WA TaxID=1537102 RepID=L1LCH8_THEEQ|nr:conserved hypothetical protein [Theileria equi strain WA]EKX72984.1 conserved hypothetical protein [Theileria equi strain WA]|eukprot:XP_004832436.1 conserved hypothetical protein [Theileria equi strain WA]